MNKQILKYSSAVALLLESSSAQVTDSPIGLGGPAPCLDSWIGVWSGPHIGGDIHFFHGFEAKKDKGLVGIGSGHQSGEGFSNGTGVDGYVIKTNPNCQASSKYSEQSILGDDSTCSKLAWQTVIGTPNKYTRTVWGAESLDGSFYIVVGMEDNGAG